MSRIGRSPITVPADVDVKMDGNTVTVKGPKGVLTNTFSNKMIINADADVINVQRLDDKPESRSLHGLTRTLLSNMVTGVTEGFKKTLEVNGVGYRAVKENDRLIMNLGFSHQVIVDEIPGISIEVPAPNRIVISGIDKQVVGQFAADIRSKRPPEPYKGKGIKYAGEIIRRKEGKTGK